MAKLVSPTYITTLLPFSDYTEINPRQHIILFNMSAWPVLLKDKIAFIFNISIIPQSHLKNKQLFLIVMITQGSNSTKLIILWTAAFFPGVVPRADCQSLRSPLDSHSAYRESLATKLIYLYSELGMFPGSLCATAQESCLLWETGRDGSWKPTCTMRCWAGGSG